MNKLLAMMLVLMLVLGLASTAFADTQKFSFKGLGGGGMTLSTACPKAGGSKFENKFYVTPKKSVVISGKTYTSNLVGGDKVVFYSKNSNYTIVSKGATCIQYDKTKKARYKTDPIPVASYYLYAKTASDSAHTNVRCVGQWTP